MVLESTRWALCCRVAGCLSSVGTYLSGTVLQGCRLLKCCWNLPALHCVAEVQAVQAVAEPTCRSYCCRCKVCLSGEGTYLLGTVLCGCGLFKWFWNLPAWHCVAGVQAVKVVSEPTCQALCLRGCRLFKLCLNISIRHCVAGVQSV